MTRYAAGDRAYARSCSRSFTDPLRVSAFVALAADLAFRFVQVFGRSAVERTDTSAEISGDTVRQRQRIETEVQFAPSLHATGTLDLRDCARHVAARRNDDATGQNNGKHCFQIDSIPFRCALGAYAVDETQRDPSTRRDGELLSIGSRLADDRFHLFSWLREGRHGEEAEWKQ